MVSCPHTRTFAGDEDGSILVFWAFSLVVFLGMLGMIFDLGRQGSTQSELQSFADSVVLAAAAELDGAADAITRAQGAAALLISDTQTFGEGSKTLSFENDVTLTFYAVGPTGGFVRDDALLTTSPFEARFAEVTVIERDVVLGFGAVLSGLAGSGDIDAGVAARSAAKFELEACNVAPVGVCLPSTQFNAATSIGETMELSATSSVNVDQLVPGQLAPLASSVTGSLDGLQVCAGLPGGELEACLLASREPETACSGQGGHMISAEADGSDALDAIDTRFDQFTGLVSDLAGNSDFSGAPNVLTGMTNALGLCLPLPDLLPGDDIGLPADDCLLTGGCAVQGDGDWSLGRDAYIETHYDGSDPFPDTDTRFEFYQAEIAASTAGSLPQIVDPDGLLGGGGVLGTGFVPQMCAPQDNTDPERRLMVMAGLDCSTGADNPPVQQYFEVFVLGPSEDGVINVEITACLGGECGEGNLETEVRDIVRLVE